MKLHGTKRLLLILLLIAVALLCLSEVVMLVAPREPAHLYSGEEGWQGASILTGSLKERGYRTSSLITTPSLVLEEEDASRVLVISLGPQREYSLSEAHSLKKFLDRGGRLIAADDRGRMDRLTGYFEVSMVTGQLYDQNFVDTPDQVKFKVDAPFFDGFVLMNRPASLTFSKGLALITTTTSAWVDKNGNGINDNITSREGEAQGTRYVCMITDPLFREEDRGCAVFISDPSLFMNEMIGKEQNLAFILSLVEYLLPDGGSVVFDDSVHEVSGSARLFRNALYGLAYLTTDINMKIIVGTLATMILLAMVYIYDPPSRLQHLSMLDRTGLAEIVEPELRREDLTEIRKTLLDKVRIENGFSVEAFSNLRWSEIRALLGSEALFELARNGSYQGRLEDLVEEVERWERK